jgi:hypothetical protein
MLHTLRGAPLQGTTPLPVSFRKDLAWFKEFLPTYNGVQLIIPARPIAQLVIHTTVTTLRAVWEDQVVEGVLPDGIRVRGRLLATKELFTIFVALTLWGEFWAGKELHINTTAAARVAVLIHGKSRDLAVLHIARGVWMCTARLDITLKTKDIDMVRECIEGVEKWAIPHAALTLLHDFS